MRKWLLRFENDEVFVHPWGGGELGKFDDETVDIIEAEPALEALRLARQGLLSAIQLLDKLSPAWADAKKALDAVDEALGITPESPAWIGKK